jgi:hypothetical protein
MKYVIFTVCTANYKDAYDFVIDSWLKTDVSKILIYTDDPDWKSSNKRIEIIHLFKEKTDNWLKNTGRRAFATKDVLENKQYNNVIFLDIDCYLLKDFEHVFWNNFDIGVVRFEDGKNISAGMFFIKKNNKTKDFGQAWINEQEKCHLKKRGTSPKAYYKNSPLGRPKNSSYAQLGFNDLIRSNCDYYNILKLSFDKYSLKVTNVHDPVYHKYNKFLTKSQKDKELKTIQKKLEKQNICGLHFYNTSYRNKFTVDWIFDIVNKKKSKNKISIKKRRRVKKKSVQL